MLGVKLGLLGVGLLLLAGCSPLGSDAPQGAQGSSLKVPATDLVAYGLAGGVSANLEEIVAWLGEPLRLESRPIPNRLEPGQTDTLSTLHYDGLRVEVYEASALNKAFVTSLTLDGLGSELGGVRIGDERAVLEAALGQPDHIEGDSYLYALVKDGLPTTLQVEFADERVSRLTYGFYWE